MKKETWKSIEGFRDDYEISSFGRVKRKEKFCAAKNNSIKKLPEMILKGCLNHRGYETVRLSYDYKKSKSIPIHRLVAKYFVDNPENKKQVNHKDGNKLNNHYSNLEWSTRLENLEHAVKNGLLKRSYKRRLKKEEVISIRENTELNNTQLSEKYNLSLTQISNILNKRCWVNI